MTNKEIVGMCIQRGLNDQKIATELHMNIRVVRRFITEMLNERQITSEKILKEMLDKEEQIEKEQIERQELID